VVSFIVVCWIAINGCNARKSEVDSISYNAHLICGMVKIDVTAFGVQEVETRNKTKKMKILARFKLSAEETTEFRFRRIVMKYRDIDYTPYYDSPAYAIDLVSISEGETVEFGVYYLLDDSLVVDDQMIFICK